MITFTVAQPQKHSPVVAKARGFSMNRDRATVKKNEVRLRKRLKSFFRAEAKRVAALFRNAGLAKSGGEEDPPADPALIEVVLAQLTFREWQKTVPGLAEPYLAAVAVDASQLAGKQLGLFGPELMALMRTNAKEWATRRAAELVGMKEVAGVLVPNPNAAWQISDATRDAIAREVRSALAAGSSADELADAILRSSAFSEARATMIARTEMALADIAGTMEAFHAAPSVVGKRWLTAQDDRVSDECRECEEAGVIGLDDVFPSGNPAPPNHPNCRCAILPVFDDELV